MNKNEAFEGKGTRFTISNVPLFFAKVTEDNMDDYKGKLRYKITAQVDAEMGVTMEDNGFNVKVDEDGNYFIDAYKLRVVGEGKEAKTQAPPKVVFADGTEWNYEEHGGISNGSTGDLEVFAKYVKVGKDWKLPLYLNKIILIDFIPYQAEAKNAKDIF